MVIGMGPTILQQEPSSQYHPEKRAALKGGCTQERAARGCTEKGAALKGGCTERGLHQKGAVVGAALKWGCTEKGAALKGGCTQERAVKGCTEKRGLPHSSQVAQVQNSTRGGCSPLHSAALLSMQPSSVQLFRAAQVEICEPFLCAALLQALFSGQYRPFPGERGSKW